MPRAKEEWVDLAKGLLLLGALLVSGAGVGYWYGSTADEEAHQRELSATRKDYRDSLDVLAGRVGRAADEVADAAVTVAGAADTADKAAIKAGKAADKAAQAPRPVVIQQAAPAPKTDNQAINRAVTQANSQLKGKP